MKALLKLINTNSDGNKLLKICKKNSNKILHKKHGQELNKSIINEGGFFIFILEMNYKKILLC